MVDIYGYTSIGGVPHLLPHLLDIIRRQTLNYKVYTDRIYKAKRITKRLYLIAIKNRPRKNVEFFI